MKKILYAFILLISNFIWLILYLNKRDEENFEHESYLDREKRLGKVTTLVEVWFIRNKINSKMFDEFCGVRYLLNEDKH